jgi:O-antigen biosynthesis protein WbqP
MFSDSLKRTFDFLGALLGLLVTSPIILILSLVIRRQTGASGIFSQIRVGRYEQPFTCHKLRTMRPDTPDLPTHAASVTAATPLGRVLRRTKLDELPQLWNVLKGEMSFVGPRPCLPSQFVLIAERRSRGVYSLRPGITGLAQIKGIDMSDPLKLAEMDAEYLSHQSFLLDLQIILTTIIPSRSLGRHIRVRHQPD